MSSLKYEQKTKILEIVHIWRSWKHGLLSGPERESRQYKGHTLPPAAALERTATTFGVAPKQAERARQTFTKSAEIAQFIDQNNGAFIEPAFPPSGESASVEPASSANPEKTGGNGGNGGDLPPELDPIIKGLIGRLPKVGSVWPSDQRKLWLDILENTFQLVYRDDKASGQHE